MPHITTAERYGMKKGVEKTMPMLHNALATIIEIKFGEAGQPLGARAARIKNLTTLQKVMDKLKRAQSLAEAEKLFTKTKK